ncbi:MAG: hypothetical protein V4702_04725 [Patescibacteria group bacterium]
MYFDRLDDKVVIHTNGIESRILIEAVRRRPKRLEDDSIPTLSIDQAIGRRRGRYPACDIAVLPDELHLVASALELHACPEPPGPGPTRRIVDIALELAAKVRGEIELAEEPLIQAFNAELDQIVTAQHPLGPEF